MAENKTLLDTVRASCRVKTSTTFDAELTGHIRAAVLDMRLAGIHVPACYESPAELDASAGDALLIEAVTLYTKGHFGFFDDNQKYLDLYDQRKAILSMAGGYNAVD